MEEYGEWPPHDNIPRLYTVTDVSIPLPSEDVLPEMTEGGHDALTQKN